MIRDQLDHGTSNEQNSLHLIRCQLPPGNNGSWLRDYARGYDLDEGLSLLPLSTLLL